MPPWSWDLAPVPAQDGCSEEGSEQGSRGAPKQPLRPAGLEVGRFDAGGVVALEDGARVERLGGAVVDLQSLVVLVSTRVLTQRSERVHLRGIR